MNNIKIIFFLLLFQLGFASIHAQSPTIDWQRCYGGSNYDFGKKIIEGYYNTLILAGDKNSIDGDMIYSINGYDIYLFKLDTSGSILSAGSNGGNSDDFFADVTKGIINGYFIVGTTNSSELNGYHGGADFFIARTNNNFNNQWEKCFGGSGDDIGRSIVKTYDSCFVVVGGTESVDGDVTTNHGDRDLWIVKIDQSGNLLWQRSYGGSSFDEALNVTMTSDHGFLIVGLSASVDGDVTGNHGAADFWVVKTDSLGRLEWENSYGGSGLEVGRGGIEFNNNYYIIGTNNSIDGDVIGNHLDSSIVPSVSLDAWLLKLDLLGNLIWQRSLGGGRGELGLCVLEVNNYLLLGCESSSYDGDVSNNKGSTDFWPVLMDTSGNIIWQNCFGGTNSEYLEGISYILGHIYLTGISSSNNVDVSGNHGLDDFWLVKLSSDSMLNSIFENNDYSLVIYPNPVDACLKVTLKNETKNAVLTLYDALGNRVNYFEINNQTEAELDVRNLLSGMYYICLSSLQSVVYKSKILIVH